MLKRQKVTGAELAILEQLWEEGPNPIRELVSNLYPEGGASAYATVQKLLHRLAAKGFVGRQPEGRANIYSAVVSRAELIEGRLQDTADALCDGSLSPLLTHLVNHPRLSSEDVARLRRLVEELDSPNS